MAAARSLTSLGRVAGALRAPATLRAPAKRVVAARAMSKSVVATDKAPAALGPYSQAVRAGDALYVSGQIGLVPGTKDFAGDDVESQTEQVMKNMGEILKAAGADFDAVVKTTILLADMDDFAKVNAIYGARFPNDPPARACFTVKTLPLNAKIEIDAVAYLGD